MQKNAVGLQKIAVGLQNFAKGVQKTAKGAQKEKEGSLSQLCQNSRLSCQLDIAEGLCRKGGVGGLLKFVGKKFGGLKRKPYFCTRNSAGLPKANAEIAQLVEHDLAKVGVASSSLVFRSYILNLARTVRKFPSLPKWRNW